VCIDFLYFLSETFLVIRRTARDLIISLQWSSRKVPLIFVRFYCKLYFLDRFSKNIQISNFTKIRPVGAELFHPEGQTDCQRDGHDKLIVALRSSSNAPIQAKLSLYRPGQAPRVSGGWGSEIFRRSAHEDGKIASPTHRPPLLPRIYPWYSFLYEDESIPGRIKSMKNSKHSIEIRIYYLLACTAMPQQRAPPRATFYTAIVSKLYHVICTTCNFNWFRESFGLWEINRSKYVPYDG